MENKPDPMARAQMAAMSAQLQGMANTLRSTTQAEEASGEVAWFAFRYFVEWVVAEMITKGYRTNDIIVLPSFAGAIKGCKVRINGTVIKPRPRQAVLLLILAQHAHRWGSRCASGPSGAWVFTEDDIRNLSSLVAKLAYGREKISILLRKLLSPKTHRLFEEHARAEGQSLVLLPALVEDLNRIIAGKSLYQPEQFEGITLSKEALHLASQNPKGESLRRLNRLLIEHAYPREIVRIPSRFLSVPEIAVEIDQLNEAAELDGVWRDPNEADVYRVANDLRKLLREARLNEELLEGEWGFGYALSTPPWNILFSEVRDG